MPELPEVETVKTVLVKNVKNKTIKDVVINYPRVIENVYTEEFIDKIVHQKITDIKRRGKWLIFKLTDLTMLSHLRMEGKYFLETELEPVKKHDLFILKFTDGTELRYNDTRRFGKIYLFKNEEAEEFLDKRLGLEPWDNNLTKEYLSEKFVTKKTPIKTALLDQSVITGLGNIYVNEVLFLSKINPNRRACDVSKEELKLIIKNTREVLEDAISLGGTTIISYAAGHQIGQYQNKLKVHFKKGHPCEKCNSIIKKESINGRGTYYCPSCQKK